MKKKKTMIIAMIVMIGMTQMSCGDKESIVPDTKPAEEEITRGYWEGSKFIELKAVGQEEFMVMPRLTADPISPEEAIDVLTSLGAESIRKWSNSIDDRFIVKMQDPPKHEALYVSYKYKCSEYEDITSMILPNIIICMDADESVEAFLEIQGEHLTLKNAKDNPDGTVIYYFDCDLGTSDEVLDLNTAIHSYPGVKWCEPNRLAPVIYS